MVGSKLLNSYATKWVCSKTINDNLSLWNSIIVGYFRSNQYGEVLRHYAKLRRKNIGIQGSAITFGLKSCIELGNSEFGRNLHAEAYKFGLSNDQYVGSSLIGFYCKCDQAGVAAKVYDEITDRDVVAYTSMITGYAHIGKHSAVKAFTVARDMQRNGFEPNRVTLVSLLQCTAQLGALDEGKMIHGYAIRRGMNCLDEVLETCLIDMYVKCDDVERAAATFYRMDERSIGSWNALITGYLRLGQPLKALNLFLEMVCVQCELDMIALANGLLSCAELGYFLIGKTIHCYLIRKGIHLDLVGTTALIDMYSKCKHLKGAMDIFYRTRDKDCILFNVMITGYLCNGFALKALGTFHEMVTECIRPNASTIVVVLSALCDMEDKWKGKCVHGYVFRQGFDGNTEIANQFINMYARWGLIGNARKVFDRIKVKDVVSWTSIMTKYVNCGLANEALALFRLMQIEILYLDSITFMSLLQGLNQLGSVILVREVHGRLYRVFLYKDALLINSLITTYSKWGKLALASNLFEFMSEQHLSSWNTIIAAHGMHGDGVKALSMFEQMKKRKVSPDEITLRAVLSACSHSGLVEEGLSTFNSMMAEYGIVPSDKHYGCVVDLLGRAGRVEEAYDLLGCVPSRQNISTLGALLAACRVHGNSEMGERIGKWILDVDPHNTSAYCSVSNLYAGVEKWDEVAHLGAIATRNGLKRTPGYSLINVG